MYIVKGIIVDAGASYVQDPLYDDKLKVRIPSIHGWGDLVKTFKEERYTKDEDLPWCTLLATATDYYSYYPVLQYKAQNYAPADMVYVQVDTSSSDDVYMVIGLYAKYNEEDIEGVTTYNGIDVSEIVANKVDFPAELTTPPTTITDDEDDELGDEDEDLDPSEDGSTKVNNATAYKGIFGYPFKKKQSVSCPFGKPGKWKAGRHTGVDLSGPSGTAIYAVGDGYVAGVNSEGSDYGNHVVISHGTVKKEKLWTLYAHMRDKPLVKVGQAVKGTQEVNGVKQKGTQLGVRGSTGSSSGPHLHFEFRKGKNSYYSYTDPNKYVSF